MRNFRKTEIVDYIYPLEQIGKDCVRIKQDHLKK